MDTNSKQNFVFFGTEPLALFVLNDLEKIGFLPSLVVAARDGMDKKKNPVFSVEKKWALERNIPIIQPEKITADVIEEIKKINADFFIVASYGKILPQALLDIPKLGTVNLHPSLLPKLRGPSPMRSAILNNEKEVGVSIMVLNNKMDEGPIIAQKKVDIHPWPQQGIDIDKILASEGTKLLAEVLPKWIAGEIVPMAQDHNQATYCKEFTKQDGLLDLAEDGYKNYLKFCAYDIWPGTYFFITHDERQMRVKITDADFVDGKFQIKKVIPEGKKEMDFQDFLRGYGNL